MIFVAAVLIALGVFGAADVERHSALQSATAMQQSQRLLTAMLDQETGTRGYFDTRRPVFLQPWFQGTQNFSIALGQIRSTLGGDSELAHEVDAQARIAAAWHAVAEAQIEQFRDSGSSPSVAGALDQKGLMDSFRAANSAFATTLGTRRNAALSRATWLAVLLAAGLSFVLALGGLLLMRRGIQRDDARRGREAELRELMQVSDSEQESQSLLIHHIERTLPGAGAAVLNRNNSDDRLEVLLGERVTESPLHDLSGDEARPRDCLAVRLSRPHDRRKAEQSLATCAVCGKLAADIACEPLLVGGKVIGSVLVASPDRIPARERAQLRDSVIQAAPIIAHQRSLALAERRAASDALTGLPNRRAADDTIKRMAAQASRSAGALAAVLMDLDHFKKINDVHGHDQGDEALAAVASIVATTIRASDFAARYGGEEFLLLLPDATAGEAQTVAEKLRAAIENAEVGPTGVTASFGIAAFPADAVEPERLLRKADQALYAAKRAGRNCVRLAEDSADATWAAPAGAT